MTEGEKSEREITNQPVFENIKFNFFRAFYEIISRYNLTKPRSDGYCLNNNKR